MASVLKKCRDQSELLTEPKAPIQQPSEANRYRGFQLIALTDEGVTPSFSVI